MSAETAGEGVQIAVELAPTGAELAGGDFYLILRREPRHVIVVGDVMGKGQEAAPYAARAKQLLQEVVEERSQDPAEILERFNTRLYAAADFDRYVAACAVIIDAGQRAASWALAGHIPPVWLDTGVPVDGARPAFVLGVGPACGATSAGRRPLRPNEGLAIFTDGLEDVLGPGGDRFGIARICHTLANDLHQATPNEIVTGLKRAACNFGEQDLYDDLCIIALRLP